MYRPKNCMNCGGKKMQSGGLDLSSYYSNMDQDISGPPQEAQQPPMNSVQDMMSKGLLDTPNGFDSTQQWYQTMSGVAKPRRKLDPYNALINLRRGTNLASLISTGIERGRQNQYDYTQQASLGQMNPMPSGDFQPTPYNPYAEQGGNMNPFSYYSKFGGNLKKIAKMYHEWSNDAGPMDMTDGTGNPELAKGGYEIDRMLIVRKLLPQLLQFGRMGHQFSRSPMRGRDTDNDRMKEGGEMASGGNWLKGAVNPDHKGWCTPLSNPHCTGRRRAFALMMKKNHGFHDE